MSVEAWNRYLVDPSSVAKWEFDRLLTAEAADPYLMFQFLPYGKELADGVKLLKSNTGI